MKFGIIGTNFVSDFFMSGTVGLEKCEVVAVSATSMEKAENFAKKYDIPHCFDDYTKMHEAGVIEAVYVAVPNGKHKEISLYFLERKIPVFCEKPCAGNLREVSEMIDCAKANNTYFHEGLIPFYAPNMQELRKALEILGPIRQVTFNFSKYSSRYDAYLAGENPTTFRSELANGAIMDLGVYPIGVAVGLWGKPDKIYSTSSLLPTGADVSGTTIFCYPEFNVSISYSKASDTEIANEICGELGTIVFDRSSQLDNLNFIDRLTQERRPIGVEQKHGFYYQIEEMIECIEKGEIQSKKYPFAKTLEVHEVMTTCRKQSGIVYPCDL